MAKTKSETLRLRAEDIANSGPGAESAGMYGDPVKTAIYKDAGARLLQVEGSDEMMHPIAITVFIALRGDMAEFNRTCDIEHDRSLGDSFRRAIPLLEKFKEDHPEVFQD